MHILYLHQYYCPPGGAGNDRSQELSRFWAGQGHSITVLTTTAYFPDSYDRSGLIVLDVEGVQVIALPVSYSHMMGFRRRVTAFLKFFRKGMRAAKRLPKPDLIYSSSTPPTVGEMGRRLARRWGVPYVFETVDVWPDVPIGMGIIKPGFLANWLDRRVNRIYAEAAHIVALSDGMRDQVLSHGVPPEKVTVSYNGTNLRGFPYVEREPREGLHIIYTGTVGLANGLSILAPVSLELEERGLDVRFTVLGQGNDLEHVQALIRSAGATGIRFLKQVPKAQVPEILASADVGLVTFAPFPVLEANSANKFYDYLASGLPVLTNYEGWQAEYLRSYNCGLSSPMRDGYRALADNVEILLRNPDLRREMGRNGRRLAENVFDRERIARDLLTLFERILTSPQSPTSR